MPAASGISLEDKLAADAFGKSYREFLLLKPTHVRWNKLAFQALDFLRDAEERNWSMEKLSDYLHCPKDEAEICLRRFVMSKKINRKEDAAERMRQAFFEWTARFGDDQKEREAWVRELSQLMANQMHAAALEGGDLLKLSADLEGTATEPPPKPSEEPRKWGPQWKD